MEGISFTLTGTNPSNVFTNVTDAGGQACFNNLPADDYVLTEQVPAGYEVSNPKSGSMPFHVTTCQDTTVTWLNTAAFTDSLFRTATVEQWATSIDQKGKRKAVKCKPDKVDFKLQLHVPTDAETGNLFSLLVLKTNMPVDTLYAWSDVSTKQIPLPLDTIMHDVKRQVWVLDLNDPETHQPPNPGFYFQLDGRGLRGKLLKVNYEWHTKVQAANTIVKGVLPPGKPIVAGDMIVQILRLPMPNLHNVGQDLDQQGTFPLIVGSQGGINSVLILKYKDVQKSFVKDNHGAFLFHTDSTHCLAQVKGKTVTKQLKAYPPDIFGGNKLFAEVLALKLNIISSQKGKFPSGLDTLIYDYSAVDPSPLDGHSVGEICVQADSILMCNTDPKGLGLSPRDYYMVVHRINSSFSSAVIDTLMWSCTKLSLKGVKTLKAVPWLRANPGSVQSVTVASVIPPPEPIEFSLKQNYPNPFNPTTTIQFDLPEPAIVSLKIYNMLGQEIATLIDGQQLDDGTEEVDFDASTLPSGVYFYRVIAQGVGDEEEGTPGRRYVEIKKMLLLR